MAVRREHPYIWTTWLPRLLTGENAWEWAVWLKAHHQNWDRAPSDFNQAQWIRRQMHQTPSQKRQQRKPPRLSPNPPKEGV